MLMKKYLVSFIIIALISSASLINLVLKSSPLKLGLSGILFFFILLFIMLSSIFTLLGFYARLFYTNNEFFYGNFYLSFRQGLEGSIFIILIMLFQMMRILNIFVFALLLLSFVFFELYFQGTSD